MALFKTDLSVSSILRKILTLANQRNFIFCIWLLLGITVTIKNYFLSTNNNYLIFKYAYLHAVDKLPLYDLYPQHHQDSNHYGPLFSLLFSPFAVLPNFIGMTLWQLANIFFLYFAISKLPLSFKKVNAVYWIVAHEMLTSLFSFQFNISIAAIIVLSFVYIEKQKNIWATFFIALGFFVKLYGIVGLAFFFFVKQKPKFILYGILWIILFFVLPMAFFSPQFILQSYHDWYVSLSEKQMLNASLTSMQDISVMGMARRLTQNALLPNLPFLIVGITIFMLPYFRIKQYQSLNYRLLFLASTLIFTVIFSNSSESPTYIIAFMGVAIWFVIQPKPLSPLIIVLFVFAFLLTSLSPSDLFPKFVRDLYIKPYSLKALPCLLIWIYISYQLLTENFLTKEKTITNE